MFVHRKFRTISVLKQMTLLRTPVFKIKNSKPKPVSYNTNMHAVTTLTM